MRRAARLSIAAGALSLMLATLAGAYGSHALRDALVPAAWDGYRTAVEYQFYHGLGLLALGLLGERHHRPGMTAIGAGLFALALLLFCGGIYAVTLGGFEALAPAIPVGGVLFALAWLWFAVLALAPSPADA
jgi:uncharacterized membrane protein YgdD (TMEM256/DUF423 family)